jgi:arylformamidase
MKHDAAHWESLYNNRVAIPEHPQFLARWAESSERARRTLRCYLDVPFGTHPLEKLDIFQPQGASRALLMFIHGGYWRALDKKDHSFLAEEFTRRGVTVAVPNHALCPAVTIEDIVRQILQACAWLHRNGSHFGAPRGSLCVAGHSAGAHLAAMTMAALWPKFAPDLPRKMVQGALAISGLYDLRDIVNVPSVNVDVRLTTAQAQKVSPMFYPPATDAPLYLAVGGKELPPFVEQNRQFGMRWKKVLAADIPCPDDHHFAVLDRLAEPSSALFRSAMAMMKLD